MHSIPYVMIGASGHHHQVTDAIRAGLVCPPSAIAPGDAGEDVSGLAAETGAKAYPSWRGMLEAEKPHLVVVNSWYGHLAEKSVCCLEKGIHVYSEKPLAASLDELACLEAVYSGSNAALGCMLNLNCCGWYKAVEACIERGDIGEVRLIHAQKSYRMGVRGPQYQNRKDYGGTIPWIGIHALDWVLGLGGECEQLSAYQSRVANGGNGDMETDAVLLLRLKGGVLASADMDFLRPTGSARHDDDRLRVTGTRGMVEAANGRVWLENENPRRELALPESENPFDRFLRAIESGRADVLARRALYDTRVALLAREAADTNTTLSLS